MKKLILSAASLMLATALSFAGTPETKGEAKPETKIETKAEARTETTLVYHYTGRDASGKIQFAAGEPLNTCDNQGPVPCRWESSSPMTSPQTDAYINSNADVTDYKSQ